MTEYFDRSRLPSEAQQECLPGHMGDGGIYGGKPLLSQGTADLADGGFWFDRLFKGEPGLMKVIMEP
jgi:hypothetical protein